MSDTLVIYIIIGIVVILAFHNFNKPENMDNISNINKTNKIRNYNDIIKFDNNNKINLRKSSFYPSIGDDFDIAYETLDNLQNNLHPHSEQCSFPPQSDKQFHKDFFAFRDKTQMNSSMRLDMVDNIVNMKLDGNLDIARRQGNIKIKDIFDESVKVPEKYHQKCARLPFFDKTNPHGWKDDFGTPGTHITADDWKYENERVMNGGEFMQNMTGNDPFYENVLDLKAYE